MNWIFLSPHFDDAAFSCGGLIWERARAGDVIQVWTVCGGEIPPGELSIFAQELHQRWQTEREAVDQRRREDDESCDRLGATPVRFPIPDCIYRRAGEDYWIGEPENSGSKKSLSEHLYSHLEAIFGSVHPAEMNLIDRLRDEISKRLPEQVELVCPIAIGRHVDHQLVRLAAERLKRSLWYYADFPYVLEEGEALTELGERSWVMVRYPISPEGLEAWLDGILAHRSQISTFWEGDLAVRTSLELLIGRRGGYALWRTG